MSSAFVMQNVQGFMSLSYVYGICDSSIQVLSMVGIVYYFVSWGRARAGKRHLSFCKRWRFVAQSQIWLLFLLLEIFGFFFLRGIQWICVTMHHSPLIPRLKPEFRWRLRVERSKVSYTSAMAACEKAKIGFQATALWSRSKGPKIVKAANWRHSCGARPVNGRKPWNCFVRRRIPRWHRIWWCFFYPENYRWFKRCTIMR